MNQKWIAYLLFSFIGVTVLTGLGCSKCDDTECFTPPPAFEFELQDSITGADLIFKGTYDAHAIRITSVNSGAEMPLRIDTLNQMIRFNCLSIGWESGSQQHDYQLHLSSSEQLNFKYVSNKKDKDCCTFYEVDTIDFGSITTEWDAAQHILLIKLSN